MAIDDRLEKIKKQTTSWIDEFKNNQLYEQLTMEQQKASTRIIETYVTAMYTQQDRLLGKWTQKDTVSVLVEYFPDQLVENNVFYQSIVPVLTSFFTYLESMGRLKNASTLIKGVEKAEPTLLKKGSKIVSTTTVEKGSQVKEESVDEKNTPKKNEQSDITRPMRPLRNKVVHATTKANQRRVEKIGRNESCPCGSGKKYKKCHGR